MQLIICLFYWSADLRTQNSELRTDNNWTCWLQPTLAELDMMEWSEPTTLLYLGEILYNKTVVEGIHLGEEKFWCWGLHTGTGVAFLIKTAGEVVSHRATNLAFY